MATQEQVDKLAEAMCQLLDDMGKNGLSVCVLAKAHARIAYEPFCDPEDIEFIMPLQAAKNIVALFYAPIKERNFEEIK